MSKISLEDLTEEALQNAREDRKKADEMLEQLNKVFDIDLEDQNSMQPAMLIGSHVVSLLEQKTRSNEQLVRLAQIKEREESKLPKDSGRVTYKDLADAKIRLQEEEDESEKSTNAGLDSEMGTTVS